MELNLSHSKVTKIGTKVLASINHFLYNALTIDYKPLLFFRVAIGLFILLHFLSFSKDINLLFGPEGGIFPSEISNLYIDDYVISRWKIFHFLNISIENFNFLFSTIYVIFSIFIITGFFTRFSAFGMLIINTALIKSTVFFSYGVDYFTSMSLFYLIVFPSNINFSISNFFNKKKIESNFLFYRRFIQIHLCIAYFFSGLNKIVGYNWRNGESVWKAMNLPYSNFDFQFNLEWMKNFPALLIVLGWSVIIIELFYPLILFKSIKQKWLILVICMHLGIAAVLNLYFFSVVMIIWNLTAFYDFNNIKTKKSIQ